MKKVVIESPLKPTGERYGDSEEQLKHEYDENIAYARAAMRDCFNRGEAPFASHLLYPQVLDDADPIDRKNGMRAGLYISDAMDAHVVYIDLGISHGMKSAIGRGEKMGKDIEYRSLPEWTRKTRPSPIDPAQWATTGRRS